MDTTTPPFELERSTARDQLTELLGQEAISALHIRSDVRGWLAVAACWLTIVALLLTALLAITRLGWWSLPVVLVCVMFTGGRILGLAILSHEASHRTLFNSPRLNDLIGDWLCAAPVYLDLKKSRQHHARHHVYTGTDKDVDLPLIQGFPTNSRSLMRKFFRDFSGQTGVKSLIGFALMNAGQIRWNVTGVVEWLPERPRHLSQQVLTFFVNSRRTLIFHALFFTVCWSAGVTELFFLWWAGYLFAYPFCIRVRSIAEHAVTERSEDMMKNTRTTRAGFISRALFAPYHVNFHIEHHCLVAVPFWQLPRLHQLVQQAGILPRPPGYWQVIKLASSAD